MIAVTVGNASISEEREKKEEERDGGREEKVGGEREYNVKHTIYK